MREDFDGEIVDVQEDRSKWWQNRRLVIDWRVPLMTAIIALPALLAELLKARS